MSSYLRGSLSLLLQTEDLFVHGQERTPPDLAKALIGSYDGVAKDEGSGSTAVAVHSKKCSSYCIHISCRSEKAGLLNKPNTEFKLISLYYFINICSSKF